MSKKPPEQPSREERQQELVTEAMRARVSKTLEALIVRFQARLENPEYEVSPSDIVGCMQILRGLEDMEGTYDRLRGLVAQSKAAIKEVEDRLFGLLG